MEQTNTPETKTRVYEADMVDACIEGLRRRLTSEIAKWEGKSDTRELQTRICYAHFTAFKNELKELLKLNE